MSRFATSILLLALLGVASCGEDEAATEPAVEVPAVPQVAPEPVAPEPVAEAKNKERPVTAATEAEAREWFRDNVDKLVPWDVGEGLQEHSDEEIADWVCVFLARFPDSALAKALRDPALPLVYEKNEMRGNPAEYCRALLQDHGIEDDADIRARLEALIKKASGETKRVAQEALKRLRE